jgi:hypothetical protein
MPHYADAIIDIFIIDITLSIDISLIFTAFATLFFIDIAIIDYYAIIDIDIIIIDYLLLIFAITLPLILIF